MSRRLVSVASCSGASAEAEPAGAHARSAPPPPRRRCRSAAAPDCAKAAAACSSSVDLPMPGSPPTRIAEAGTRPPPSTRSSSAMPLRLRGSGGSSAARSPRAMRRPRAGPSVRAGGAFGEARLPRRSRSRRRRRRSARTISSGSRRRRCRRRPACGSCGKPRAISAGFHCGSRRPAAAKPLLANMPRCAITWQPSPHRRDRACRRGRG